MPCRDEDTFVSLILLLIDPYSILLNCCNSSCSDTLSMGNEDSGLTEDGSDVNAGSIYFFRPTTMGIWRQWVKREVEVTQHLLRELTENIHQSRRVKKRRDFKEIWNRIPLSLLWPSFSNVWSHNPFTFLKVIRTLQSFCGLYLSIFTILENKTEKY